MTENADRLEERLSEMFSKTRVPASDPGLDPLLATAKRLHQIGNMAPSAAAVQRTRFALLRASPPHARPSRPWWPKLATATPLAIVLMIIGTTAVFAAPSALPNSPLYEIRNLREAVEIRLAATPGRRASLYVTFARQRADQVVHIARGKGASPTVISTLLRDISSRTHAADAEAHGEGAADRAPLQHDEGQIQTELTQLHDSGTLTPDANQQLENTIHDVQSSEPTPTPEPTPSAEATTAPVPTIGSSNNETP